MACANHAIEMTATNSDLARTSHRRDAIKYAIYAFASLTSAAIAWFVMSSLLDGGGTAILTDPIGWLASADADAAAGSIPEAAGVVASVLGIAITVVAIVVELAANRYSHRITWLFLTEPVNAVVLSIFMLATVEAIWVAATGTPANADALLPNAGFALTILLVSVSLLILLPYFAFVFQFLSPLSVIQRLADNAYRAILRSRRGDVAIEQARAEESIDELLNVARTAVEQSDRGVAMACVDTLEQLLLDYQEIRDELDPAWFQITPAVASDPDFVALAPEPLKAIEEQGTWVEVKIFRQYLSLIPHCIPDARDVANLIAIRSERIGRLAKSDVLRRLCIRCFNSYLRATINARDPRSSYYILNQYRLLADGFLAAGLNAAVKEIAHHLRFYGQLAYRVEIPFLLEVTAHDVLQLIESAVASNSPLIDELLDVLLELDLEIRNETQESSLLGVRRAQLRAAALFESLGHRERVDRICADLRGERMDRLNTIYRGLMSEDRAEYWEVDDRGVNFGYLAPERRPYLTAVHQRLVART